MASWPAPIRTAVDRFGDRIGVLPMHCTVCGRLSLARIARGTLRQTGLRETGVCRFCFAASRPRQMAVTLLRVVGARERSLAAFARGDRHLRIYNTEGEWSALHRTLRGMAGYVSSEFVAAEIRSGTVVDGVLHQDLQTLSFDDASFDLVLTSDVLEHVPDPYRAHAEIRRVLRPGGSHVFTVPYQPSMARDDVRARLDEDGRLVHHAPPDYHSDPVHPEGALVYTIFGREMLDRLRELGFAVTVHHLYDPFQGIIGPYNLVFQARRTGQQGVEKRRRAM